MNLWLIRKELNGPTHIEPCNRNTGTVTVVSTWETWGKRKRLKCDPVDAIAKGVARCANDADILVPLCFICEFTTVFGDSTVITAALYTGQLRPINWK